MVGHPIRCRVFVGRRAELAALDGARKALARSSGSFLLVSGEAGIGKTRLLSEFTSMSNDRRARNLVNTECLHRGQQPLGPIRSLARSLVQTAGVAGAPMSALRALAQIVPEELPAQVAAENAGVVLEKEQLYAALLDFLRYVCAKRATVITIEDIHWADESTLQFLNYLAPRLDHMRLLIVATCRSDDLETNEALVASMAQLLRAPSFQRVTLEPFAPREIREVVRGSLQDRERLSELAMRDIESRSEGNPFFAEELVKDYVEHHDAARTGAPLPLSIRATIAQRLTVLRPNERSVLEYAAVLGQRFDPSILGMVLDFDEHQLMEVLHRARDLNLLVDDAHGRQSCRFRHNLTRQAIYDGVPSFAARKLHQQILLTLEGLPDAGDYLEELAYHAWEAGDLAKTLHYNERAGEAAFALRALPESLTCFARALNAARELDDRARLLERVGAVNRVLGHSHDACAVLESAVAIRLEQGDVDAATMLVASVVGQRYNLGDQQVLTYAERFIEEYASAMSAPAHDHLHVICARVASAFCDFRAAERFLNAIADPATLAPSVRQNYLIVQLMRHAYFDDLTQWRGTAELVERLLPQLSPEAVVSVEAALAMTGIFIGANAQIERAFQRLERVEREWGFRGQRLYAVATKASYFFQRGLLADAQRCVEEVVRQQDFFPARRVAASVAAHLAVVLGDDELWNRIDPEVLVEARAHLEDPDCVFILAAHAAMIAAGGSLTEAQGELRAAIGALHHAPPEAMYVVISAARYLPLDEIARVEDLVETAARGGGEATAGVLEFMRAIIASRRGDARAERHAHEAARRFASLGWSLLEAQALEIARPEKGAARERSDAVAPLSSRECEIAELVASGLKNYEIAKRLNIGSKTVEKHLSSLFDKLGVRSRSQVAALMASRGASAAAHTDRRG